MNTIKLNGTTYNLACTLRVAYVVQNQHNHKSYTEVLSSIGEMTLEEQIDVLYASFAVANKNMTSEISRESFRMLLLDDPEFTATTLMQKLKEVVAGIFGKTADELDAMAGATSAEDSAKNV